jgi:hypothetical protein
VLVAAHRWNAKAGTGEGARSLPPSCSAAGTSTSCSNPAAAKGPTRRPRPRVHAGRMT